MATEFCADAILLGAHQSAPKGKFFAGSTADALFRGQLKRRIRVYDKTLVELRNVRCNLIAANIAEFYEAFDVDTDSPFYLAPIDLLGRLGFPGSPACQS